MTNSRLLERLESMRTWAVKPRVHRWLLIVSVAAFAGATYLSLVNLPPDIGPINWPSLLVAALLVLPIAWLLGLEFREISLLAGHGVSPWEAFRVAMVASASNLLPIPGAVTVKTGTLMAAGRTLRSSVGSNLVVGVMWVAVALLIGSASAIAGSPILAWGSLVAGVILLVVGAAGIRRSASQRPGMSIARVVAIEVALTFAATARIWFVMSGIGVDASITAAVWLVVVSVLATVVGLFPAGLGLREGLSAAVAPLIGIDPAAAVLVSAVDRVVRLSVLALIGTAIASTSRLASRR